jgi:O-antigen/teichoic acid export membrane protein
VTALETGIAEDEFVNGGSSRGLSRIGRFGWGLADQVVSSFTNFLLGLLIARTVGPKDLGAFTLAFATYTLSLGAVRAVGGKLVVVRHSAVSSERWREGVKGSAGTALMVGVIVGGGCLVAGAVVGGSLRVVLTILGLFLPALLVQDAWRLGFFARGRGGAAFLNDMVWAVVMLTAIAVLGLVGRPSVAWFTFTWAGAGSVAALAGMLQIKVLPSHPLAAFRWLRGHRDLAPRFLAEFGITQGTGNLILFGIGSLTGLAQLGRLRAGQIALGPLNVLFAGVGLVNTPEGVRLLRESPRRLLHGCRWISLALASAALAWGTLLLALPRGIGEILLGASWEAARSLLLPLTVGAAGLGATYGPYAGLYSLAAAKRSLRVRYIDALTTATMALAGAAVGGALGAAWGIAIAACLENPIAWWQFAKALDEYTDERQGALPGIRGSAPG